MKFAILLLLLSFSISAKVINPLQKYDELKAPIVCMNGVAYYYIKSSNYSMWSDSTYARAFLAPVVDNKTLKFKECQAVIKKKKGKR